MGTFPETNPEQNELSSQAGQAKSAAKEHTAQEIRSLGKDELLLWIQEKEPNLLQDEVLEKFKAAHISGKAFLKYAGDMEFFQKCNLPIGTSSDLADLAKETKQRDSKQAGLEEPSGTPSKKRGLDSGKEASQSPNQKRLRVSQLPGSDAIYQTESAEDCSRLYFPANAQFSNFFNEPGAIVADKTRFIPLLEQNPFEYMFLRPRRWGKSTFLNMLAAYYDVNTRESFEDIFGGLEIGKQPTKWRNKHLILLFNFSTITTVGSLEEIKQSVFDNISRSLYRFLLSYQDILGDGLLDGDGLLKKLVIPGSIATSLTNVLELIYRCGYTAFVGVDEYDAPANTCLMAALAGQKCSSESKALIGSLEDLLKSQFFAVMKEYCGQSVAKYWLTGVLPAFRDGISPLTATQLISSQERYQSLCGFTQEDVEALVKRAFGDLAEGERKSTLYSLKYWYNGYVFSPTSSGSKKLPLYNPQLSYTEEANAVYTSRVLSVVGENGPVTVHDLIDRLYSTAKAQILTELSFAELMRAQSDRSKDVTWSLLYYLGIVTYHNDPAVQTATHTLCVPNRTMFHLINKRIRAYLKEDASFSTRMRQSYKDFMRGTTTTLIKLLEDFFSGRPIRSLAATEEPTLEAIIEVLWYEQMQCATQVHLVVDPTKPWGCGRNGFVDLFVGNSERDCDPSPSILVMELKFVLLKYLWKAKQPNPNADPTSQNDYEVLLSELRDATEDELLDLKYSFFDKQIKKLVTLRVGDTLRDANAQLTRYMDIISDGRGGSKNRGVDDSRVLCLDRGGDVLQGYVIICLGGRRVICRHLKKTDTQYSYEVIPEGTLEAVAFAPGPE